MVDPPPLNNGVNHSPHVLRLLRLVREGTPAHASRASALLGRYAASGSHDVHHDHVNDDHEGLHPSVIIWDLIGRLVTGNGKPRGKVARGEAGISSGLFDFHWATRSNCALALESVARCLPVEDRRHFFQDCEAMDDDDSLLWLNVFDLRKELHNGVDGSDIVVKDGENQFAHLHKKRGPDANEEMSQLCGRSSSMSSKNKLDIVIERGRLLLASSGEQYDWTSEDEEALEYIREQESLQHLDKTGISSHDRSAKYFTEESSPQPSFLQRRVMLQRQILARRLGLGGILSAPIVTGANETSTQGRVVDDIVKDEEFISDFITSAGATDKRISAKSSTETDVNKPSKRRRKGMLNTSSSSNCRNNHDDDDCDINIDIRALLVAESNRPPVNGDTRDFHGGSRHHNPQLLLSTEVAYRSFDPHWTVRHGALLGTLSLLRAWRVHNMSHSSTINAKPKVAFGKWPHDILSRCICIIALDRFADFSGSVIAATDEVADEVTSGAVVAPVREMAAQIIAILLEAAPREVWDCTSDLLAQLYTRRCDNKRDGWEVRHGVLLVWKYISCLARLHSPSGDTEVSLSMNGDSGIPTFLPLSRRVTSPNSDVDRPNYDNIIENSIVGLSDESDDVRAVAAQVLLQMMKSSQKLYTVSIVNECSIPLWIAVCDIRRHVSSCASDLLALLAAIFSHDCTSAVDRLKHDSSLKGGEDGLFRSILQKLAIFVKFDSSEVRISCYRALCLILDPSIDDALTSCSVEKLKSLTHALCDLVETLFPDHGIDQMFTGDTLQVDSADVTSLNAVKQSREQAWCKILDSLANIIVKDGFDGECQKKIKVTAVTLILRYFDVNQRIEPIVGTADVVTFHQDKSSSRDLVRGESNDSYSTKIASSRAISLFYHRVCWNAMSSLISLAIQANLQSPWSSHFEAACLLHTAIATSDNSDDGINPFFVNYLPSLVSSVATLPNVLIEPTSVGKLVLNDAKVRTLYGNGLATFLCSAMSESNDESRQSLFDHIPTFWNDLLANGGISLETLHMSSPQPLSKSTMRLSASISGAIVHCGGKYLPTKITPIIRSLMTSLKNEDCEHRATKTCSYIANLVTILSDIPFYMKARDKLLENICSLACDDNVKSSDSSLSTMWAQHCLEHVVADMGQQDSLKDLPAIWKIVSPLLEENYSSLHEQLQSDSMLMLNIISGSITKEHNFFRSFVTSFATSVVKIACHNSSALIRRLASTSITNICRIDFDATIVSTITSLVPILSDFQKDDGRCGGCELLLSILNEFNVSISPFVAILLPLVMRLMTDPSEECSKRAASAFAILVRIAPVSAGYMERDGRNVLKHGDYSNEVSEDVVRHLILGKPLPPCTLPNAVSVALCESGTNLRPYQLEGVSWLKFLAEVGLNGALCDDMGLGKTLQSLLAVAISHCSSTDQADRSKKSLVVCPSTVVGHWVGEIRRFFPRSELLSPLEFTGNAKARRDAWEKDTQSHSIVVTSYSVLRSDCDLLAGTFWDYCILDEGHLLKNPKTGTPIQNNVHELWATFDFLMPNFLGSESGFVKDFAGPITRSHKLDASASEISIGMECLKILHQQVLPFVLRREKSHVIKELPPKIITDIPCVLSSQQQVLYENVIENSETKAALDLVDESLADDCRDVVLKDSNGPKKPGSTILCSLLQLRLICTHPIFHSMFASKKRSNPLPHYITRLDCSGKLMALNDLLRHSGIAGRELTAADGDPSTFIIEASSDISSNDDMGDVISNEDNFADSLDHDVDRLESSPSPQSKCLIFAQFTQSLDVVEKFLFEPHMPSLEYLRLNSSVPGNQRSSIIESFNEDRSVKVLLLTTKVGGADTVIFLEPDWNPFVDLQAMDRAHRIGQTKTVNVYRLITTGTIEEKMMKYQQRKKATADAVVNTDNSTMYSMGTDRLLDIFTFRGAGSSSSSGDCRQDDNVLSYLDNEDSREYASLSVDSFLREMV